MADLEAIVEEITAPLLRRLGAGRAGFVLVSRRQGQKPQAIVDRCRDQFEQAGHVVHTIDFAALGPNPVQELVRLQHEVLHRVFFVHFSRNSLNAHNTAAIDAVRALNLHREVFKTEGLSAVFWLHVLDLAMLHEKASNFLEYRARAVELEPHGPPEPAVTAPAISVPNNLPFPSLGPAFVGREQELLALSGLLSQGKAAAIAQTIKGLGGVGKTRLAVEFAWRHVENYRALLFARADSPDALQTNVARLAAVLDLPEREAPEEAVQIRGCAPLAGDPRPVAADPRQRRRRPRGRGGHRLCPWTRAGRNHHLLSLSDLARALWPDLSGPPAAGGGGPVPARPYSAAPHPSSR